MFTTGFKFFFGLGLALVAAAVVVGYATGGGHVGPITWGWKGGVGNHVSYVVLMGLGVVAMATSFVIVAFRDADPSAQAHYLGVDSIVPTAQVTGTPWPVVGAFGAALTVLGLALSTAFFIVGLVVLAVVAFEWTMDAWADRATGDATANRALRDRIMAPIEIPVAGLAIAAVMVLAASRIFLNVSKNGAVFWAGAISVVIFGLGILYAARPKMNKNVLAGLVLATGVAVIAGGILAAVDGEREIELHGEHGDEHGEDHAEEDHSE
jgi:hypothetical protein